MRREDYPKLRDLLNESIETERPIEYRNGDGVWVAERDLAFPEPIDHYRVQPAPPQKKFRPMNQSELVEEALRGTVVRGAVRNSRGSIVGPLVVWSDHVTVCGWEADFSTLTYANPDHPKCGELLQVEITE